MSSAIDAATASAVLPASLRSAYAPAAAQPVQRPDAFAPAQPVPTPAAATVQPAERQPVAASDVSSIVDTANSSLELQSRSLRFRVNPEIDDVQIQILDSSRDKVIRSIPSEDMVAIAARMRELSGLGSQVDVMR